MEIEKVVLKCSDLIQAEEFYSNTLGFNLNLSSTEILSIQVGSTNLVFEKDEFNSIPCYHFAFLILKNKLEDGRI